jgi:Family of unknown function (DUF6855)
MSMAEGTPADPWRLKTPSGTSGYEAWRDDALDPPALVVQVGKSQLRHHAAALDDLHAMLTAHGDWMPLGSADEQKPAADGTVEAWARSGSNCARSDRRVVSPPGEGTVVIADLPCSP